MYYYNDKFSTNLLNNQNYLINKRIKSNLLYTSGTGNDNFALKFLMWMFLYIFRNINSDIYKLLLLHIFILVLFFPFFIIFWDVFIYFYLFVYFSLSRIVVNYYFYFKNTKVLILWFRKNLGNDYEDKLIRYRYDGYQSIEIQKNTLFISFVYSGIVNVVFFSLYFIIKFYA